MSRTANAKLKNATQRNRLQTRTTPYFDTIAPRRVLGYVRKSDTVAGCWIVRVEIGRTDTGSALRRQQALGTADDLPGVYANGVDILSYEQARSLAAQWTPDDSPSGPKVVTVRDAYKQHTTYAGKRGDKLERNRVRDCNSVRFHLLRENSDGTPREGEKGLGDIALNDLTTEQLETWRDGIEGSPATKLRVWKNVLSCLRQAYRKESNGIASDKAWENVPSLSQKTSRRKVHYSNEQAHAIIDAARAIDAPVGDYFEALFVTGARPGGELFALTVGEFNPTKRQLSIRGRDETTTSKTGARKVSLDQDATALFTRLAAGRPSTAPLLSPDGTTHWNVNGHQRRIKDVLLRSGAPKDAVPYSFRHTFISRRLEQGMPVVLVANHCGTSIAMIESNYAEFLPSETLRWLDATAPKRPVLTLVKTDEQQEALQEAA